MNSQCEKCEEYWNFKYCPECGHKNNQNLNDIEKRELLLQKEILDSKIIEPGMTIGSYRMETGTVREILSLIIYHNGGIKNFAIENVLKMDSSFNFDPFLNKILQLRNVTLYYRLSCSDSNIRKTIFTYDEIVKEMPEEHYVFGIKTIFTKAIQTKTMTIKYLSNELKPYLDNIEYRFRKPIKDNGLLKHLKVSPIEALGALFGFLEIPTNEI